MARLAPHPVAASPFGPESGALGPLAVKTANARHLCTASFVSATLYYPDPAEQGPPLLPLIVLVGGWGCGEQAMAAWGPFYASHGIVAMTIGTPTPFKDQPPDRSRALLDAVSALQAEHTRAGSPLHGRLDVESVGVQGWSLGGGGAQLAAMANPALIKCAVALSPHSGFTPFPAQLSQTVPVLIIVGQNDRVANPVKFAWPHYRATGASKVILEVRGGDHAAGNGPTGGLVAEAVGSCVACKYICGLCCIRCGCTVPCGTFNSPTGRAAATAEHGAVGGMALAWLKLHLKGNEGMRAGLQIRPDIASGFACELMGRAN